jgi:hypothetical protein
LGASRSSVSSKTSEGSARTGVVPLTALNRHELLVRSALPCGPTRLNDGSVDVDVPGAQ